MDDNEISQEIIAAVEETLTHYGEIMVASIKEQLLERGNVATGALYNSVVFQVTTQDDIVTLEILAADYMKYIDAGRLPGSRMPPLFDIVKWITSKKLSVLGTEYSRTGLIGKQRKSIRNKALAKVRMNEAQDIVKVAWKIAKAISIRGLKPANILAKTDSQYGQNIFINVDEVISNKLNEIVQRQLEESVNNLNNPKITIS